MDPHYTLKVEQSRCRRLRQLNVRLLLYTIAFRTIREEYIFNFKLLHSTSYEIKIVIACKDNS